MDESPSMSSILTLVKFQFFVGECYRTWLRVRRNALPMRND